MTVNDFHRNLLNAGYIGSPEGTPQMYVFVSPLRYERHLVVTVVEEVDFVGTHRDIEFVFHDLSNQYNTDKILFVVFSSNIDRAVFLTHNNYRCWLYNTVDEHVMIFETQPYNFYDVRSFLSEIRTAPVRRESVRRIHNVINFTNLFILINVLVHMYLSMKGNPSDVEFVLENGGLYLECIKEGEIYRFFTSMFMHFDWIHLLGNMFVLFLVGRNLENMVGKVRFPIIYLASGIGAGIIAEICYFIAQENVVCVGASGAVYGLVGALLWVLIANKERRREITLWQVIVGIALSLGQGFVEKGVSIEAHIGGLVCGFLIALITYRRRGSKT